MRRTCLILGLAVLAAAWLGPLPDMARRSFSAHMTMHVAVVAVAAPLLAAGLNLTSWNPARVAPRLFAPIPASVLELAVVWVWHTPALHHAARHGGAGMILEQASFLLTGLILWLAALRNDDSSSAGAGVVGLLLTSMHMTFLGALLALTPRPLFNHAGSAGGGLTALDDQHLGGVIMLAVGGLSYLAGGISLTAGLLTAPGRRV